jgi:small subunit ribosomal protein S6
MYEGLFILDSNRYARDSHAAAEQINELVRRHGGEMLASRLWEERRLAYPIEGHRKGTYWLTYFKLNSANVAKVNRDWQLNDLVLRALVLKIDPRIGEALVQHALTGTTAVPRSRAAEELAAAEKAAKEKAEKGVIEVPEEVGA